MTIHEQAIIAAKWHHKRAMKALLSTVLGSTEEQQTAAVANMFANQLNWLLDNQA